MEQTLVILKQDCVQRRLVGRLLARFEDKGLRLVAMKTLKMDRALAERLYAVHQGRDFYEPLLAFMTSSPCIPLVLEGPSAISVVSNPRSVAATARPSTTVLAVSRLVFPAELASAEERFFTTNAQDPVLTRPNPSLISPGCHPGEWRNQAMHKSRHTST